MVTHRWWGNKFCKRTCKDAYLRELALDRDRIRRWYGFPSRGDSFKLLSPETSVIPENSNPGGFEVPKSQNPRLLKPSNMYGVQLAAVANA
jgi:hypothetical protein